MALTPPPPFRDIVPASPGDDVLVHLTCRGDPAGLGALYDRYADAMLRVAWRLTDSSADAEDVVHDVFVRLPALLQQYEHRGALLAWLRTVTAREALMRRRGERRRREDDLSAADAHHVSSAAELAAEVFELERHLALLPDTLRTVFVLRQVEGFTHEEIAALLHISVGASRVRLSRALDALRTALDPAIADTPPTAIPTLRS